MYIILKNFLGIILCITSSIESVIIHFVSKKQILKSNPEQLILLSELIKLTISFVFFNITKNKNDIYNIKNIYFFAIPAIIYTISNNITFLALDILKPSMFNLLTNLKIPVTIILANIFLDISGNIYQLFTVILVFIGNSLATFKNIDNDINVIGICYMVIYSICSGSAAVYGEYIMRYKFKTENFFLQSMKFCICSIISNLLLCIVRGNITNWPIEILHLSSISSIVMNGMFTGLTIKYSGSIVKTYATSLSTFLSAFLSYFIWRYEITMFFYIGAIISFIGVNIYIYDKYIVNGYYNFSYSTPPVVGRNYNYIYNSIDSSYERIE